MDRYIYEKISELIKKRIPSALCIITDAKGSTPRKAGSKMIVTIDAEVFGSIGGGELEHFVVQKAIEVIESKTPQNFSFGLKTDFQMACGGRVQVFVEPLKIPDQLVIFGGGHIGKALIAFAQHLDFQIVVIDDRKDIFNDFHLPEDAIFLNENYADAVKKIIFDNQTYVCSVTYHHLYDKEIALLLAEKNLAYLGVIASKNKAQKIRNYLKDSGVGEIEIEKIDMPMGLDIGAETPEEIAVSVLAKIIEVRRKK